jgi:hypothetical protein
LAQFFFFLMPLNLAREMRASALLIKPLRFLLGSWLTTQNALDGLFRNLEKNQETLGIVGFITIAQVTLDSQGETLDPRFGAL